VYGRENGEPTETKFPARQSRRAFEQIATQHHLDPARCVFAKQNPIAIAAGAFHNDVVAVGNERVHLVHEHAFEDLAEVTDQLNAALDFDLITLEVHDEKVSLAEAVSTYLFNSQLLTVGADEMLLLCPSECERSGDVRAVIERILADPENPVCRCEFLDLTESMQNGGGPACLRLRVVLTEEERAALPKSTWLTESRYHELRTYVSEHYRDELTSNELADPKLALECRRIAADVNALLLG
ncbi:MAG: N-succinylarginine dihydrolase, partial [Planctomycetota bacterium]